MRTVGLVLGLAFVIGCSSSVNTTSGKPDASAGNTGGVVDGGGLGSGGGLGAGGSQGGADANASGGMTAGGDGSSDATCPRLSASGVIDAGFSGDANAQCPDADKSSDPVNCGACGHVCPSIRLFSERGTPGAIAVDGNAVYWRSSAYGGSVMKRPLVGGGTPAPLISGLGLVIDLLGYVQPIAVDATSVYFAGGGGVLRQLTFGGERTTLGSPAPDWLSYSGVAISFEPTGVYTYGMAEGSNESRFLGKMGPDSSTRFASGVPRGVAVDTTSVYLAFSDGVAKVPLGGGASTRLFGESTPGVEDRPGPALAIAVDATSVYWTSFAEGGSLLKGPIGGGEPTKLACGVSPRPIAVDDMNAYFSVSAVHDAFDAATNSSGLTALMKVPLNGGSAVMIAHAPNTPVAMAVDKTGVYWTSAGDEYAAAMRFDKGACQSGVCKCPDDFVVCHGSVEGNVCVDTSNDSENCGGCGNACPSDRTCQAGVCACPGPECSGRCVNTDTDMDNCGGCGKVCDRDYCDRGICMWYPP